MSFRGGLVAAVVALCATGSAVWAADVEPAPAPASSARGDHLARLELSADAVAGGEFNVRQWMAETAAQVSARDGVQVVGSWLRDGGLFLELEDGSFGLVISGAVPRELEIGVEPAGHPRVVLGARERADAFESARELTKDTIEYTLLADADVWSGDPDFNSGSISPLYAGKEAESFLTGVGYLLFRSSYFIAGTITSASIRMWVEDSVGGWNVGSWAVDDGTGNFWFEDTVTWNTQPAIGLIQSQIPVGTNTDYWLAVDITSIAQRWNDGTHNMNGVFVAPVSGAPDGSKLQITSREMSSNYPFFYIEYTPADTCTYSLSPTSATYPAAGGNGSFTVSTQAGCSWSATASDTWIRVNSGSGTGNGTVTYDVAVNPNEANRSGTITVEGETYRVNQEGACGYTISPASGSYPADGGIGSFAVSSTQADCGWNATTGYAWISITSGSGSGNGTVRFNVAANSTTSARTGTIVVAGKTYTVNQEGQPCTYSIAPTGAVFPVAGGRGTFKVFTQSSCSWSAVSSESWIRVLAGTGDGNGEVTYEVSTNTSDGRRTGTITVAHEVFTVQQEQDDTTPPPAPTLFYPSNGAEIEDITPTLQWQAVIDPEGADVTYDVEIATDASFANRVRADSNRNKTFFTPIPGLDLGTYYWHVRANDTTGNTSDWSDTWSFEVVAPEPPEAPSSLQAMARSANEVQLSWQDNSDNEFSFSVEARSGDLPFAVVATVGDDLTGVLVSNLQPSTEYTFRVQAHNSAGSSAYSNEAVATTLFEECVETTSNLCLADNRFKIDIDWIDFAGNHGFGRAVPMSGDTGYFWFFDSSVVEVIVKVLDGRSINGYFWVFYGSLSNVEFTMTITDQVSGSVKQYSNPAGQFASQGDTSAILDGKGLARWMTADRFAFADPVGTGTNVAVTDEPPELEFEWYPELPGAGSPVTFTDNQEQGIQRNWDFGDGSSAVATSTPSVQHTFTDTGAYEVLLVLLEVSPFGRPIVSRQLEQTVEVVATQDPVITISGPGDGMVGVQLNYSATVEFCSPASAGWTWDAGADGDIQGAGTSSSTGVVWSAPGTKTVSASNSACGGALGTLQVEVAPPPVTCEYSVSPTDVRFDGAGGMASVWVNTGAECEWQASSNDQWIVITAGASATGSAGVSFSVAENPGAVRTGTVDVAGEQITVTQAEFDPDCTWAVSPQSASFTAAGGEGTFEVTTGDGCEWQAVTDDDWITIVSGAGTGSGTVSFAVEANPGDGRQGLIGVEAEAVAISQQAPVLSDPSCESDATTLCLDDRRFELRVRWRDFSDTRGPGRAAPMTADTGYFWFFSDDNVEVVVKVLDGRGINGHYWVFFGALSNVEYELKVTDTVTGASKTYYNESGTFGSFGDTAAFEVP